jgi:two-component system alkaline phosphatase synthesis response regulator PhoP
LAIHQLDCINGDDELVTMKYVQSATSSGIQTVPLVGLHQRAEIRLLVVDNEPAFRAELARLLEAVGFSVEQAGSGRATLARLATTPFDGLVLDLDVPDLDGVACMQEAHAIQPGLVILVVTASPNLRSAIASIKVGVADYLVKPLDAESVASLVSCVLERHGIRENHHHRPAKDASSAPRSANDQAQLSAGAPRAETRNGAQVMLVPPLRLDHTKRLVTLLEGPGRAVRLTRGETIVLASLMAYPDLPVSCQYLVRAAWQYELDADEAGELIRPYIFRLRRKLEPNPKDPQFILTMRGQGYMFASSRGRLLEPSDVRSI